VPDEHRLITHTPSAVGADRSVGRRGVLEGPIVCSLGSAVAAAGDCATIAGEDSEDGSLAES
jgi:hypothetical protein